MPERRFAMDNQNELKQAVGETFLAWADNYFTSENKSLYIDFLAKYPDQVRYCTQSQFMGKIRAYSNCKSLVTPLHKSNGINLSRRALDFIEMFQDDDTGLLKQQREVLSLVLVEVIQQNVGDDRWTQFSKVLADQLDFLNCLQTQ